jgi:hypothetical protein
MSQVDQPRATAEVKTGPDGSVAVLVTIPTAKGPVYLSLSVSREEFGGWQADLPLWPHTEDLRKIRYDGVVTCYPGGDDDEFDEGGNSVKLDEGDEQAYSWEVIPGGTAYLVE